MCLKCGSTARVAAQYGLRGQRVGEAANPGPVQTRSAKFRSTLPDSQGSSRRAQSQTNRRVLAHTQLDTDSDVPLMRSNGRLSVEDEVEVGVLHETPVSSDFEIRAAVPVREVEIGARKRQRIQGTTADLDCVGDVMERDLTASPVLDLTQPSPPPPEVVESLERDLVGPTHHVDLSFRSDVHRRLGQSMSGGGDCVSEVQVPGEVLLSRNSQPLRVSSTPAERRRLVLIQGRDLEGRCAGVSGSDTDSLTHSDCSEDNEGSIASGDEDDIELPVVEPLALVVPPVAVQRAGLQQLDQWDLNDVFSRRASVMRTVPRLIW